MSLFTRQELALLGLLDFATANQLQDLASLTGLSDNLRRRICAVSARRARHDPGYDQHVQQMWDHIFLSDEFSNGMRTHPDLRVFDVGRPSPERRAWLRAELSGRFRAGDIVEEKQGGE